MPAELHADRSCILLGWPIKRWPLLMRLIDFGAIFSLTSNDGNLQVEHRLCQPHHHYLPICSIDPKKHLAILTIPSIASA